MTSINGSGQITGLSITTPGSGYTSAPTTLTRLTGTGTGTPVATFFADQFTVSGVRMTAAGSGYTGTPTYTFDSGDATPGTTTLSSVTLAANSSIGGAGNTTIDAVVSGGFSLSKVGAGILTLTAANTYSGATNVNSGTLALGANNVLPDTAVSIGNATLNAATFSDTVETLDVTAAATINLGSGATLAFAAGSPAWIGTLNLTGTFVPGSSLKFGNSDTGLDDTQLGLITATGWTSFDLDADGYLIATSTGGNTYADWLALNPPATGFTTDSDNDGLSNGVDNILGSNPNTYNAGLTEVSATPTSVVFKHTLNPTIASDVTYSYQWSTDMVEWKASTETNTGGTTATIVPSAPVLGVVTVTITITGGPSAKLFGRLVAVK